MTYLKGRLSRLLHDDGGWIVPALMGISALGGLLGRGSQAASESRMSEAQLNNQRDAIASNNFRTAQGAQFDQGSLDLQRKGFEEGTRSNRAKQQATADLLMNLKPTQIGVSGITPASISGGLSLGDAGREALTELIAQARAKQLAGDTFEGGRILPTPQLTPIPQAGKLEKFGGIAGILAGLAGGLGSLMQPRYLPPPPSVPVFSGLPGRLPGQELPRPLADQAFG